MSIASKCAIVAGGLCAVLLAAGCGAHAPAPRHATVQGCLNYGVEAIHRHITVTREPAACRGLSKAQAGQAVAGAIRRAASGMPKAASRRRAAQVAPELAFLIRAAPASSVSPAPPGPGGAATPGAARRPGRIRDLGMSVAALIAWIITAGSGSYLVASWMSAGGSFRGRPRGAAPPAAIMTHFGLAAAGLALWVVYLIVGWALLAWTAFALLVPVAGLGIGLVTLGLPPGARVRPARARRPRLRGRGLVLGIAAHGSLAATTLFLVLFAAIGAGGGA
jgi:hypothetical protein